MALAASALDALVDAVGAAHVLTDREVVAGYATDWTGRFGGPSPAVVRPGSTAEVAAALAVCRAEGIAVVPQGGNTGLVGGSVPGGGEVVLSLRRLDAITDVDADRGRLTAGAGTTIAAVQAAAARAGWAYGVDWGARQTATIGGAVATDAGGVHVVRNGSTRHQVVGLEAVLGSGLILDELHRLDKDATGYSLSGLLCGSEGTLGVITRVRLRLVAPAASVVLAAVACASWGAAEDAASTLRRRLPSLSALEAYGSAEAELVAGHLGAGPTFSTTPSVTLLVEAADTSDPTEPLAAAVAALRGAPGAVVATDGPRRAALWRAREALPEAIAQLGIAHKLDVAVPPGSVAQLVEGSERRLAEVAPGARLWVFGHIGEANLHLNVTGATDRGDVVDDALLGLVVDLGGTVSAEHGIGRAKRRWLAPQRGDDAVAAMRAVRAALDPDGILNPGVLLDPEH